MRNCSNHVNWRHIETICIQFRFLLPLPILFLFLAEYLICIMYSQITRDMFTLVILKFVTVVALLNPIVGFERVWTCLLARSCCVNIFSRRILRTHFYTYKIVSIFFFSVTKRDLGKYSKNVDVIPTSCILEINMAAYFKLDEYKECNCRFWQYFSDWNI